LCPKDLQIKKNTRKTGIVEKLEIKFGKLYSRKKSVQTKCLNT